MERTATLHYTRIREVGDKSMRPQGSHTHLTWPWGHKVTGSLVSSQVQIVEAARGGELARTPLTTLATAAAGRVGLRRPYGAPAGDTNTTINMKSKNVKWGNRGEPRERKNGAERVVVTSRACTMFNPGGGVALEMLD
ncbi:hypothetical protein Pcinc_018411 [Petrolisthes cinctipes]|uniref:Uncharacterized protein n=1 Tax=Petrolisthes cinctipes TaxID=88211 RepID=A0AAE1FM78_PETCI|nr:hypothetical protein Pcinc_018411 [Petrolisthes cinctipes]